MHNMKHATKDHLFTTQLAMFLRDVIVEFAVVKYLAPDLFDFPCQTFASYTLQGHDMPLIS